MSEETSEEVVRVAQKLALAYGCSIDYILEKIEIIKEHFNKVNAVDIPYIENKLKEVLRNEK